MLPWAMSRDKLHEIGGSKRPVRPEAPLLNQPWATEIDLSDDRGPRKDTWLVVGLDWLRRQPRLPVHGINPFYFPHSCGRRRPP